MASGTSDTPDAGIVNTPPAATVDPSAWVAIIALGLTAAMLAGAAVHRWKLPRQRQGLSDAPTGAALPEDR